MNDLSAFGWIAVVVFAVAAAADWFAVAQRRSAWRWLSKPTVMAAATIAVLADGDGLDASVRAWIVVAFVLSLAGDVFLLRERWFLVGLGSFLLAHLAFTGAFVGIDPGLDWVSLALIAIAPVGVRIVGAARARDPMLGSAVVFYLVAISTMFATATGTREPWIVGGAALFVASDAMLGWNRFVQSSRWLALGVITTYHLAQACFTIFATS